MKKRFTVSIYSKTPENCSIAMQSWEEDEEGVKSNVKNLVKTNISLEECMEEIDSFYNS